MLLVFKRSLKRYKMTKKMKGWVLTVTTLLIIVMAGSGFTDRAAGGTVRGTVSPTEAGLRAFLFSGKDTVSANVVNGAFQFSAVKPGQYSLLVEAVPPYRNGVKEGIRVTEGEFTDAGQIELSR
jgi:hypothetical protein